MSHKRGRATGRTIRCRKVIRNVQLGANGGMCGNDRAMWVAGVGCRVSGQVHGHVA